MKKIQAVRGMHDLFPPAIFLWQKAEEAFKKSLALYGYQEIRLPLLEKTELFIKSIGETTDILEKEIYTFNDRNNESLSLRPEGTAGCVRAMLEHNLLYHQTQKLWYTGPMFRYERPQKGRYRQFYQAGIEAFGFSGPVIEAEMILMLAHFFDDLKLTPYVELDINCLGSAEARNRYRKVFIAYCQAHYDQLDQDSQKRLEKNPLRILDSKNSALKPVLEKAPLLIDYLDNASCETFETLQNLLKTLNICFRINPALVRGLDYYNGFVFEWKTSHLGTQDAVCGGGRYDTLVENLGGPPTPAVGFSIGLERIVALLQQAREKNPLEINYPWDASMVLHNKTQWPEALRLAEKLRNQGFKITFPPLENSIKSQLKYADKNKACVALIFEADKNMLICKPLREQSPETVFLRDAQLIEKLVIYLREKQRDR